MERSKRTRKPCDLIMKGGITSGVVYPFAVQKLAKEYQLRNIGGSSAGAIASVIAGAAEYRRQCAESEGDIDKVEVGFEEAANYVRDLKPDIASLFQPVPDFKRLFLFLKYLVPEIGNLSMTFAMPKALLRAYWPGFLLCVIVAIAVAVLSATELNLQSALVFVLTLFVTLTAALAVQIAAILKDLKKNNFGICTGKRQSAQGPDALMEWLAKGIEQIARGENVSEGRVTTCGDLHGKDIQVSVMTTNLTEGRPYRLPFDDDQVFFFREADMEKVFPKGIVEWMREKSPGNPIKDGSETYFRLPTKKNIPLIFLARMSLSFPILFTSIPLWKQLDDEWKCHSFSDGGICSNFPIHFFDAPIPRCPTFGIRFGSKKKSFTNVRLASDFPIEKRVEEVSNVFRFIREMFFTAKDWKDNLQSTLEGYPERIVEISLDDKQGGFNLWMDDGTVRELYRRGDEAGALILEKWHHSESMFSNHQLNRATSFAPALERLFFDFATAYDAAYRDVIVDQSLDSTIIIDDRRDVLEPWLRQVAEFGNDALQKHNQDGAKSLNNLEDLQSIAELRLNARSGGPEPIPSNSSDSAANSASA